MILGVGVDICQNERVKFSLVDKILSAEEKAFFDSYKSDLRKLSYLCGRFAIKEALIKAFSQANINLYLSDFVVLNDDLNRPYLAKPIFNDKKVHISISHEEDYTIGFALVELIDTTNNKK